MPPARRHPLRRLLWSLVTVAVLVGIFFAADAGIRAYAEARVARQLSEQLPPTVSASHLKVSIGGVSVIVQYLLGRYDEVRLDAPELTADGIRLPASVTLRGIPRDLDRPVDSATATVRLTADALNQLAKNNGIDPGITLAQDRLSYNGSAAILGLQVSYRVSATPHAAGTRVLLEPKKVTLTSGPAGVDATGIVNTLLGGKPLPVCVASYLPKPARLTGVSVGPSAAVVTLTARNLVLSQQALQTLGTCP